MTRDECVEIIRRRMQTLGLSCTQLARMSGVNHETIKSWMYGRTYPSITYLLPVLDALGMEMVIREVERYG